MGNRLSYFTSTQVWQARVSTIIFTKTLLPRGGHKVTIFVGSNSENSKGSGLPHILFSAGAKARQGGKGVASGSATVELQLPLDSCGFSSHYAWSVQGIFGE